MTDYRRIASSVCPSIKNIYSFDILPYNDSTQWVLRVNKTKYVGTYPTQEAATQVLFGLLYRNGASKEFAQRYVDSLIARGASTPLGVNLLTGIRVSAAGTSVSGKISNVERPVGIDPARLYIATQYSDTNGVFQEEGINFLAFPGEYSLFPAEGEGINQIPEGGSGSFTINGAFTNTPENRLIRLVMFYYYFDGASVYVELIFKGTEYLLKDVIADTLELSFNELGPTPLGNDDIGVPGYAYQTINSYRGLAPTKEPTYTTEWDREIPEMSTLNIVDENKTTGSSVSFTVDNYSNITQPVLNRTINVDMDLSNYPDLDYEITVEYARELPDLSTLTIEIENT